MNDIERDDLREQAELASSHPRERVELRGVELIALLDRLDRAEARIKAVRDVIADYAPDEDVSSPVPADPIRRALEG